MTDQETITQLRSDLALANQKLALGHIADKGGMSIGYEVPTHWMRLPPIPWREEASPQLSEGVKENERLRAQLESANAKIASLEAALELGQENCDAVYNDLKRERDVANVNRRAAERKLESANQRAAMAGRLADQLEGNSTMLTLITSLLRDGPHIEKIKFVDQQITINSAALQAFRALPELALADQRAAIADSLADEVEAVLDHKVGGCNLIVDDEFLAPLSAALKTFRALTAGEGEKKAE